jgi:hypothetical protein
MRAADLLEPPDQGLVGGVEEDDPQLRRRAAERVERALGVGEELAAAHVDDRRHARDAVAGVLGQLHEGPEHLRGQVVDDVPAQILEGVGGGGAAGAGHTRDDEDLPVGGHGPSLPQREGSRAPDGRRSTSASWDWMSFLRFCRWNVIAKRCASSRIRWIMNSASLLRGRMTGNSWPGSQISSSRFAIPATGTSWMPSSSRVRAAASTCGCPPSTRISPGRYANRRRWRCAAVPSSSASGASSPCSSAGAASPADTSVSTPAISSSSRCARRRLSTWCSDSRSSAYPGIANLRYALFFGSPSSNTTIEATMLVPPRWETS